MKTYRVIAALLALVMLLGMFSGCSKNSGETSAAEAKAQQAQVGDDRPRKPRFYDRHKDRNER